MPSASAASEFLTLSAIDALAFSVLERAALFPASRSQHCTTRIFLLQFYLAISFHGPETCNFFSGRLRIADSWF